MQQDIQRFCEAGLNLVSIPRINGKPSKRPSKANWNKPYSESNPNGYCGDLSRIHFDSGNNYGLYHGASGTLALDLDDLELSERVLSEAAGVNLKDWLNAAHRAEIKSPKENRGKLLFKLDNHIEGSLHQFKHKDKVVFELRCGNCQDIIYGEHPEGGRYQFIGDPASIPPIPPVLLDILTNFSDWRPCLESVLTPPEPPASIPSTKSANLKDGARNPIIEFNQSQALTDILTRNGYKPAGKDRFIRPGSTSKAPGVVILRNCKDGIERAFSHGGDVLNDGFAHDAFDCFRLLECQGNQNQALNWNPELTRHNQKLHKQQQTKDKQESESEPYFLPDKTTLDTNDLGLLDQINKNYAHTVMGGKNVVIGRRYDQVQGTAWTIETPSEFNKRFWHKPQVGSGKKRKNQGQAWLEWPDKNYYPGGVGFFPKRKKCPPDVFNLYQGFAVQPVKGDTRPYWDHLKNIICAGDSLTFAYFQGFLAHLVQKPDEKPHVAIAMKSVEGTGKGTMIEPLLRIFGSHACKTNGADAITQRFNGTLAAKLLVFADEVDLREHVTYNRLKSVISESTVHLERKGQEIEPIPNYCRLFFASNHTQVLRAGLRERRFLLLEPSAAKAQDTEYFSSLYDWINNHGPEKLLYDLLKIDISGFNPYKCPITPALVAEKLANLSGENRYFYEEITNLEPFQGKTRLAAHELVDDFVNWSIEHEEQPISKAAARSRMGKFMANLGLSSQGRSGRGTGKFYELPDQLELINRLAGFLDVPVEYLIE